MESRGCYAKLVRTDLLKELPFVKDMFDILVSTAVTTYLGKYIIYYQILLDAVLFNARLNGSD